MQTTARGMAALLALMAVFLQAQAIAAPPNIVVVLFDDMGYGEPPLIPESCLTDLLATCADILDVELPDDAGEDSVSILPALLGTAAEPLREAIVHQPMRRQLSIRQGQWKLIFSAEGVGQELYDLHDDLGETKNLAIEHPEVVRNLTALMNRSIAEGRSTPCTAQKNDFDLSIDGGLRARTTGG